MLLDALSPGVVTLEVIWVCILIITVGKLHTVMMIKTLSRATCTIKNMTATKTYIYINIRQF